MKNFKTIGLTFLIMLIAMAFTSRIELEKKSLLDNKIQLKIPKYFDIMSEEMMKVKYPSEGRPNLIYSDETGGINIGLSLTPSEASQELIPAYVNNFVQNFKNAYPTAKWKDKGVKLINGKKIGYLELITPAEDTQIYNLIFFTDLEEKLLLCTFNCTKKDMNEWTPIAKEIMNSIEVE